MHPLIDRLHGFVHLHSLRHLQRRHAGRHGGHPHHGFHGFGGEAGFPGRGAGGFGPGRKLGSGDLQLLILALLADKPRHGYELIKALAERSNGYYSPSPGMIYPALTYLEEIGYATVEADGAKKLYSITVAGMSLLDENRAAVETLFSQLEWIGRKMEHLRRAMSGDDDAADIPAEQRAVFEARQQLKAALAEKRHASADEQRRIAAILARASAEIRGE
jgi:DNA-binding PadR family transcriptional regulator